MILMPFKRLWDDNRGQGSPEYALLLAGVVVVVIVATTLFGDDVRNLFVSIGTWINAAKV